MAVRAKRPGRGSRSGRSALFCPIDNRIAISYLPLRARSSHLARIRLNFVTQKNPRTQMVDNPSLRFGAVPAPRIMRAARVAGFAGIAAITILSLLPGSERPHTFLPGQVEHFIAYACTGFALSVGYPGLRERLVFWAALGTASGVFEILQRWIPGRSCEFEDAVVSTLGLSTGLVLGAMAAARLFAGLSAEDPEKQGKCGAK